jgi:hypothetical protein
MSDPVSTTLPMAAGARPRLDERALRRPDFVPGMPVRLADGQQWELRRPLVCFEPHDGPVGFRTCLSLDGDDDFQELIDRRDAAFADGARAEIAAVAGVELAIGRRLLLANYDLTPDQVRRLLRFAYDRDNNPEGVRIRDEVLDVAYGNGPKPSPDGIDASPMPSGESPGATA